MGSTKRVPSLLCVLVFLTRSVLADPARDFIATDETFLEELRDGKDSFVALAPECWSTAIARFHPEHAVAESFCAQLSPEDQKRFALDITTCHMADLHKPVYEHRSTCTSHLVQECLKHLTPAAVQAYTIYVSHVQTLCIRKTQELFTAFQNKMRHDLTAQFARMAQQSVNQLQAIQEMSEAQSQQLQAFEAHVEHVKDLTLLQGELREGMHHQAETFQGIIDNIQVQDATNRQEQQDWMHYQASMLLQQAQELEKQRDSIHSLSETVSQTTSNIQPIFGLQTLFEALSEGFSWLTFLLHFLGTFNILWVVTRPTRCHSFRGYIFAIVIAEAAIELVFAGLIKHGLLSEPERIRCVTDLRRWAWLIECMAYLVGILQSIVETKEPQQEPQYQYQPYYNCDGHEIVPVYDLYDDPDVIAIDPPPPRESPVSPLALPRALPRAPTPTARHYSGPSPPMRGVTPDSVRSSATRRPVVMRYVPPSSSRYTHRRPVMRCTRHVPSPRPTERTVPTTLPPVERKRRAAENPPNESARKRLAVPTSPEEAHDSNY